MFTKKLTILISLIILTSCPVLADRGGFGGGSWQGGGSWEGGRPWQGPEVIPPNFAVPIQEMPENVLPRENNQRQNLQPLSEQIKRNYNQLQREQRQQFHQNWKRVKQIR